ncbi:MAG: GDSL-type esterase/lipase family protein [Bdellovibrionota bacterium]
MKQVGKYLISAVMALVAIEFFLGAAAYLNEAMPALKASSGSKFRILCIGESTTQWGGATSYPALLGALLNEKYGPNRYEVINEGGNSTDTTVIAKDLPGMLHRYQPQIVIAMMGINDPWSLNYGKSTESFFDRLRILKLIRLGRDSMFSESEISAALQKITTADARGDVDLGTREFVSVFRRFPGHPRLLEASDHRIAAANRLQGYDPRRYDLIPQTRENFSLIAKLVKESGAKLIVMQYPRLVSDLKKALSDSGSEFVFVENKTEFEKAISAENYEEYFTDRFAFTLGHPTEKGRRLLAKAAFDALENLNER